MKKRSTDITFDMRHDSITAARILPRATAAGVRTILHEPKAFHRFVRQILIHGPARACYEMDPCACAPHQQLVSWGPSSRSLRRR